MRKHLVSLKKVIIFKNEVDWKIGFFCVEEENKKYDRPKD